VQGQHDHAPAHTILMGDPMERKKPYRINFIHNGKSPDDALKDLAKSALKKVLAKNNVTSYNLDEVVNKYISGEICNEHKK